PMSTWHPESVSGFSPNRLDCTPPAAAPLRTHGDGQGPCLPYPAAGRSVPSATRCQWISLARQTALSQAGGHAGLGLSICPQSASSSFLPGRPAALLLAAWYPYLSIV